MNAESTRRERRWKRAAFVSAALLSINAAGIACFLGWFMDLEFVHWPTVWQASRAKTPAGVRVSDLIRARATNSTAEPDWHHCNWCQTIYSHAKNVAIKVTVDAVCFQRPFEPPTGFPNWFHLALQSHRYPASVSTANSMWTGLAAGFQRHEHTSLQHRCIGYIHPMKDFERVTIDPNQCGGRPCVRGMRIRVKDVLDMLAGGATQEEILADFPDRACIAYAARYLDHAVLVAA
jgi:uncharacterized protein (DUF433 family)